MNAVNIYLNNILIPTLQQYHVPFEHILYTADIVKMQMESLIRIWNDIILRNTVLLFGTEEGMFYEPKASKLDVRRFVVVTLRNSPIETIQSDACIKVGLESQLENDAIKKITYDAINFFNKQDFEKLCKEVQTESNNDYYRSILSDHPITWTALSKLASSSAKVIDYSPCETSIPHEISELTDFCAKNDTDFYEVSVCDAYEDTFSNSLCNRLKNFEQPGSDYFVVDSFKTLSRNFEKEIQIIEYLLTRGYAFVTVNYYIQNGHVEQRSKLIRAAHSAFEICNNLLKFDGLGYHHKRALTCLKKQNKVINK